jgi:hypothetical protein
MLDFSRVPGFKVPANTTITQYYTADAQDDQLFIITMSETPNPGYEVDLYLPVRALPGPLARICQAADPTGAPIVPPDIGCGAPDATADGHVVRTNMTGPTDFGADRWFGLSPVEDDVLAIELLSFEAIAAGEGEPISLVWETAAEIDNVGFHIYKAIDTGSGYEAGERLNASIIPAEGTETQGAVYGYNADIAQAGATYAYFLADVDLNGTQTLHGPAVASLDAGSPAGLDSAQVLASLDLENWEAGATDVYDPPVFLADAGTLTYGVPVGTTGAFGFWNTKEPLNPLEAGRYEITIDLQYQVPDGQNAPAIRLRVFEIDHGTNWMTEVVDTPTRLDPLPASITTVWESDGETPWQVAIDLLAFGENIAGTVTITSVTVSPAE